MGAVGVKISIREKDRGWKKFFGSFVETLKNQDPHVRVGVFASEKGGSEVRDGELTNVEIAAIHEYGAPEAGIPERSFIRETFESRRKEYMATLLKLIDQVVRQKMTVKQVFDTVGAQIVSDINARVRQSQGPGYAFEPLKPATIARKGSSRPLIDTGRMLAAVTWAVFVKGTKQ